MRLYPCNACKNLNSAKPIKCYLTWRHGEQPHMSVTFECTVCHMKTISKVNNPAMEQALEELKQAGICS